MSQYLSRFYCGNKEGLCNFSEPIKYDQILDRQFDNTLVEVVQQCDGPGKTKGYCCKKDTESGNLITTADLENINQLAGGEVFKRDEHGNVFKGQVPLVRVNREGENINSIDVCGCGGNKKDFKKCVEKNCKGFNPPTKYEYCKMGDMSNLYGCYGKNQKGCEAGNEHPETQYMYSHRLRINDLYPDCYLNLCNKSHIDGSLDDTASNTPEQNHYIFKNNVDSEFDKSIDNYLLLNDIPNNKVNKVNNSNNLGNNSSNIQSNTVNNQNLTIESILSNN
jgi:hypothetical protein